MQDFCCPAVLECLCTKRYRLSLGYSDLGPGLLSLTNEVIKCNISDGNPSPDCHCNQRLPIVHNHPKLGNNILAYSYAMLYLLIIFWPRDLFNLTLFSHFDMDLFLLPLFI